MKKRFISLMLCIVLVCSTTSIFADNGYTTFDESKVLEYTEENIEQFEKQNIFSGNAQQKNVENAIIFGEDPGEGAFASEYTSRWTSAYTYLDDEESSPILSIIADVVLTVGGYFLTTAESIVYDIAQLCFGLAGSEVNFSRPGTVRLLHSYSYIDHLGRIYTNSDWETMVDIQLREWYTHEYASFSDNGGITRTDTFDFVLPNDANFIESDKSTRFKYKAEVIINGIKDKTKQYTSLQVKVQIEPKGNLKFKKVYASIFLPKSYLNILKVKSFTEFGLLVDDAVDIDINDQNASKGLIIQRSTWIDNNYPADIEEILKKDLKIKVAWKEGDEYSIFSGKNITIKYN